MKIPELKPCPCCDNPYISATVSDCVMMQRAAVADRVGPHDDATLLEDFIAVHWAEVLNDAG